MKKPCLLLLAVLFVFVLPRVTPRILATCNWPINPTGGLYTVAANCGIDANSTEAYDYSSGVDDPTNGYVVTLPSTPSYTVTVNSGTTSTTTLLLGQITLNGGFVAVGSSHAQILVGPGQKCYVLDGDADGYSPTPETCSTTGGAGYIRHNKLASLAVDCYDSNANAHPGQTGWFTTNRGDGSFDYNCDNVATQEWPTSGNCSACTNGSGYPSYQSTAGGWNGAVPACGVSGSLCTLLTSVCGTSNATDCISSGSWSCATTTQACH